MPGAGGTRSLAWKTKNTRVSHREDNRITRHSRTRMVLTVSFVISLVIGLSCHHPHAMPKHCRELTSASRCQDHTTSPSALAAPVLRRQSVHRIPHPTSVTIAKRPSCGAGRNRLYRCFYQFEKRNIFREGAGQELVRATRRANQCSNQRGGSSFVSLIPIEFVIGRKRPVARRHTLKRSLTLITLRFSGGRV
jgi:hypothetical protein